MIDIVAKMRAACTRGGLFAGKWALIAFAGVAAFALAVQALALVLAALALLVIALCLATVCMPEESRAVWVWVRDTLGRWSIVAGTGSAESGSTASATANTAMTDPAEPASCGPKPSGPESDAFSRKGP